MKDNEARIEPHSIDSGPRSNDISAKRWLMTITKDDGTRLKASLMRLQGYLDRLERKSSALSRTDRIDTLVRGKKSQDCIALLRELLAAQSPRQSIRQVRKAHLPMMAEALLRLREDLGRLQKGLRCTYYKELLHDRDVDAWFRLLYFAEAVGVDLSAARRFFW